MGYASYTVTRRGEEIEAGYAIEDTCNEKGCAATIDRGLDYLCGELPGGGENGCGGYFCGEHLFRSDPDGRCARCLAAEEKAKREEFCDQLAEYLTAMGGVTSADALADKPEVFVELMTGEQFILTVS